MHFHSQIRSSHREENCVCVYVYVYVCMCVCVCMYVCMHAPLQNRTIFGFCAPFTADRGDSVTHSLSSPFRWTTLHDEVNLVSMRRCQERVYVCEY